MLISAGSEQTLLTLQNCLRLSKEELNHWCSKTVDSEITHLYEAVMGSKIFRRSNSNPSLKWSSIVENLFIVGK